MPSQKLAFERKYCRTEPHPIFEDSKIGKGECIANRYANKKGLTIF